MSGGGCGAEPSETEMTFVGVDVSKASIDVAALGVTGEVHKEAFVNTSQGHIELLAWLKAFQTAGWRWKRRGRITTV